MERIESVDGIFHEGNPSAGQKGTKVKASWLTDVQEEICSIIEAAGIELAAGQQDQLLTAFMSGKLLGRVHAHGYPTLAEADAAAVAQDKLLVISTQCNVVPAQLNAAIEILPGGKINNADQLIIANPIFKAPRRQVFIGAGSVLGLPETCPDWWQTNAPGVTDMTAAINKAFTGTAVGGICSFRGIYKVVGAGATCLLLAKNINLQGTGYRGTKVIAYVPAGNTTTNNLEIRVSENGGLLDVRNMKLSGINFCFDPAGGGRNAVYGNDIGMPQHSFQVADCGLYGSSGNGIQLEGSWFGSKIHYNQIEEGVSYPTPCADGQKIQFNAFSGNKVGVFLNCEYGTYTHKISDNIFSCRDGAVWIENGSQVAILDNQFEQYGVNASAWSALVTVIGSTYPSESINVKRNNFGGGGNVNYNVFVLESHGMDISKNDFLPAAVNDIAFAEATAKFNHVGPNNWRGRGGGSISDVAIGTYGVKKVYSNVIFANAWGADANFAFVRDEDDNVRFRGKITGGALAVNTLLFTIPAGHRPLNDVQYVLPTAGNLVRIDINAATGEVKIFGGACPDATIWLNSLYYFAEYAVYP